MVRCVRNCQANLEIKDDSLKTFDGKKHKKYKNDIVVSVQDTGIGINPGIKI